MAEKQQRPQQPEVKRPQPQPETRHERGALTGSGAVDYALMLADTGVKAAVGTTVVVTTTKVVNKVLDRPKAEAPKEIWTPPSSES